MRALLSGSDQTEVRRNLARKLLVSASAGRLEERELRRVVMALVRSGEPKEALAVIDRSTREHPGWQESGAFHQLRGNVLIGMAKRTRNTATKKRLPRQTRERAWTQFREYLDQAEGELTRAQGLTIDVGLTDIIRKNREYVEELRRLHVYRNRSSRAPR